MMEFFRRAQTDKFDEQLDKAAEIIMAADKVLFYGVGSSGVLGKYGARFCSNIGKYSQYLEDPFYPYPTDYYDKAVLVALSVRGIQPTLINQINDYKTQRTKVIAITNRQHLQSPKWRILTSHIICR